MRGIAHGAAIVLVECSTGRQVWAGTAEGRSLGMLMDVVGQKLAR